MSYILSVGIDVGTSTTQLVFSRLFLENTAGYFSVPRVSITDKKIIYKSPIFETPLKSPVLIDVYKLKEIISGEFVNAKVHPKDTGSGAVIITGEAARKENADAVLDVLSEFSGEFVVTAAGPDLESVISGKGSGACTYSKNNHCRVANLDIGGGTTNVSIFYDGVLEGTACLDIGGRLISMDQKEYVIKISDSARWLAKDAGVHIEYMDKAMPDILEAITVRMAYYLEVLLGLHSGKKPPDSLTTGGSSSLELKGKIDALCFSGGVGRLIYKNESIRMAYNDLGVYLSDAVRNSRLFKYFHIIEPAETIRATVIGAGTCTTELSGSTISYTDHILPLKNIPVMTVDDHLMENCFLGMGNFLEEKVKWFVNQNNSQRLALVMAGKKDPSFKELKNCSHVLCQVLDSALPSDSPFILIIENDIGKALGQLMKIEKPHRDIVVLDHVYAEDGNYIDLGKPAMRGLVIPVIIKTLIFS